jgi:hypothetical protein
MRHTEAMIAAKNEVLAAVGVCEKKNHHIDDQDEHDSSRKSRIRLSEEEWKMLKDGEDDYGELIRMTAETSRNVLTWWLLALRRRLQVGFASSSLSFVQVLSGEWVACTSHGILGAIQFLTVGALPELASQLVLTLVDWWLSEKVLETSKKIIQLKASSRKRFLLLKSVRLIDKVLNAVAHLLVYPLTSYSTLQQLRLISASSLLASRTWLAPWNLSSPLHWAFSSWQPQQSRLKALLLSPAALWLAMTLLQHSSPSTYDHVSLFEYGCILGPHNKPPPPSTKPASGIFSPWSHVRDGVLKMVGWAAEPRLQHQAGVQDLTEDGTAARSSRHVMSTLPRITELSMLPSHLLALNLDYLFWGMLLLPLDVTHLRALTCAYQSSAAAQADVQSGANGGVLAVQKPMAMRANKVGLCLALEFTIDTAVWGGAYMWAKWAGTEKYHWGQT